MSNEIISSISITELTVDHWPMVRLIYEQGLATGQATFETESPDWQEWNSSHIPTCRHVALEDSEVIGWVALSPVSSRCVYGGVGEVSIYVHEQHRKKGIGKLLLKNLINSSEKHGYWTLQAGIMPTNKGSVALHESVGFRVVGYRERISKINGIWMDNLLLERRSSIVGTT